MHTLLKNLLVQRMKVDGTSYQIAAGTTTLTSDAFDAANCQGTLWELALGAITATGTIAVKLQGATDSAFTTPVDLTGCTQAVVAGDAQTIVPIECFKPGYRYLRMVCTRATANSAIDSLTVKGFAVAHRAITPGTTYKTPVFINNP